jgi:carboxypeptidase family protein
MISRGTSVHVVVCLLVFSALMCSAASARPADNGVVRGVAWNADNSPIGNAKVRLRNIESGRAVAVSETSSKGQFTFAGVARGSYVVELVSDHGKVLAVGPTFPIEPAQTVSTVVRLPTRRSWYASMFSNTAAAVIAAASSVGLTGVGTNGRPVSPQ